MLHVHAIDELKTGGAQTHLITMLREAILVSGVEHHVVSLFGDGEMAEDVRNLGIQLHLLDLRSQIRKRQFLAAACEVQSLLKELRPDVVEAHLTWSRFIALFAAWRIGVPLRIGVEQGDIYMNSWKFRCANFVAQVFAHRIVVCSEALRDWVRVTHGTARSKLVVMHNCVDPKRFMPDGPKAKDVVFPEGSTVFCAVGTLGRGVNKRVDVCIHALATAISGGANVKLVVCGDGEQRQELERLAVSLGIASDVKFLGTRSDVASILRACDVFCHAAPWEPFGIVALEAMSVGLPILLPDSGGIREILQNGEGGFLYPALDHQALGHAMIRFAADRDMCISMGAIGRRVVEDRFSVRLYVSRLYAIYGIQPMIGSAAMACGAGA